MGASPGAICLDTQILIWGIKEDSSAGQEMMIEKAKHFFGVATEEARILLIPSVVVGELLMRVPPDVHSMTLNLIRRGFLTAPYDLEAAAIFARLWQKRKEEGVIDQLRSSGATRSEMKADCQIVATALAAGASCIISHDAGVARFAENEIRVTEIPSAVRQLELSETPLEAPTEVEVQPNSPVL